MIEKPGGVAVNHGGFWTRGQEFESLPGYYYTCKGILFPFFSCFCCDNLSLVYLPVVYRLFMLFLKNILSVVLSLKSRSDILNW